MFHKQHIYYIPITCSVHYYVIVKIVDSLIKQAPQVRVLANVVRFVSD